MKKQEKIKEAYGEHYETVKNHIDENGWCVLNVSQKEPINHFAHHGKTEWKPINGRVCWRPISLKGIEANNGWIKIESEADLPKEHMAVFLYESIDGVGFGRWCNLQRIFKTRFGKEYKPVTHYRPITKPEPPVY